MKKSVVIFVIFLLSASFFFYKKSNIPNINLTNTSLNRNKLVVKKDKELADDKLDEFGIEMLYPDLSEGRMWFSNWSNDQKRTLRSGEPDRYDKEFVARGNGSVSLDGSGVATLSGDSPRMYVYDEDRKLKWGDVEVTIYAKRVLELGTVSSQGFVVGVRSEHQDANETNPCLGATYYGRVLYDGRAVFQKEVVHESAYSINMPSESNKALWDTPDGTLPKNVWIGIKFVVRNSSDEKSVNLELYRDLTNGENGGNWEKLAEYTDSGTWSQTDSGIDVLTECGYSADKVLLDPGTSVFVRNDLIDMAEYKMFSIREID